MTDDAISGDAMRQRLIDYPLMIVAFVLWFALVKFDVELAVLMAGALGIGYFLGDWREHINI